MNLRNRPARVAAAAGAVVVAGAATMLAVAVGTASADEPGRCLQNVNIRDEPDAQSRIVALCEAGTQVKLGAERDGWVRIDELGGWASKEFVKADEPGARGASSGDDHADGGDDVQSSHDGDDSGSHESAAHVTDSHVSGSHDSGAHDSDSDADGRSSGPGSGDAHTDSLLG